MDRRERLGVIGVASLAITTGAQAADQPTVGHAHRDHAAMGKYGDLAAANSPHVAKLAGVVGDICNDSKPSVASMRRTTVSVTTALKRVRGVPRNARRRQLKELTALRLK
jgi:hypothetical protein